MADSLSRIPCCVPSDAQLALLREAAVRRHRTVYPGFKRVSAARAAVRNAWLKYRGCGGYELTDEGRQAIERAARVSA